MKNTFIILCIIFGLTACQEKEIVVTLAVTTDVHGMIFPYDFVRREASDHSLSQIYTYVTQEKKKTDTLFFLLDNGDFLQGQPTVYYYNFIDTSGTHLAARVMNFMAYSAGTVGNHDIEAGPAVYKKIREEFNFPWLAANAVQSQSGKPYFDAYTVLHAGTKRIAILGLITPGIPSWLPKNLWPDMKFRDMVETAREWVPWILENEKPDLLVGLFHSGTDASYGGNPDPYLNENAALLVAEQVPDFDVIFAGHDHKVSVQWILNQMGDSVLIVDPGSHARYAGEVTATFRPGIPPVLSGQNIPMKDFKPSREFDAEFESDRSAVSRYLSDTITWLSDEMKGSDALFGPSGMITLIHQLQMDLSGADVSFTAPLSLSAKLEQGHLLVSDMFQLYRFENMLYTMELSGTEIDRFLEYAAGLWFRQMKGPEEHMLLFREGEPGRLAEPYYNFSSAAGIDYTLDLTKPAGDRIDITRFNDGRAFLPEEQYLVAVNSYRGNGGGGHLTKGAGIHPEDLSGRIRWSTDHDLRYYLMQYLSEYDTLVPAESYNWHCIPEDWAAKASGLDSKYFP